MDQKTSIRPYLIAFEGIDGSGKSTQIKLSLEFLKLRGIAAKRSSEPTKGIYGNKIRDAVVRLPPQVERQFFLADRREHVRDCIKPALESGVSMLLDRYFYSSVAYQGARLDAIAPQHIASTDKARIEAELIRLQDEIYLENRAFAPEADILIYLELPVDSALKRIGAYRKKFDPFETASNLERVSKAYQRLIAQHARACVIDADCSVQDVWTQIRSQLERFF